MKKILFMFIAAATLVACDTEKKSTPKAQEVVKVKVATATVDTINLTETYTAELKPFKENNITPAAQGLHIKKILVDVGDTVKEGQVIAELDATTLKQLEINLATAMDTYNRLKPVKEAGGVSKQQFVQAENTVKALEEQVDQLRKNTVIKSPISGVVTSRNFEVGDLFASMPLYHIMQTDKLKATVDVAEIYYSHVTVGMEVSFETDVYPGQIFKGTVSRISPAVNAQTRTFTVEVTVPNKFEQKDEDGNVHKVELLRPGMSTRATFVMGKRNSVMVPSVAVKKQVGSSERYVFIIKDGKAEYRFVEDGERLGEYMEILDGVKAGEQVATTGLTKLLNGCDVEIVK